MKKINLITVVASIGLASIKKIFVYVTIFGCLFTLYGCPSGPKCTYEHPINIKNLKDTIKITDTLWVESDFDARFCLEEGIFSGTLTEFPKINKWINNTAVLCENAILNHPAIIAGNGTPYYHLDIHQQNGRYQLKYGIVFPDTGIYSLSTDFGWTAGKGPSIDFQPYFDVSNNNTYLLSDELQEIYYHYSEKPYKIYFLVVVE